jgi:hypothetical protein
MRRAPGRRGTVAVLGAIAAAALALIVAELVKAGDEPPLPVVAKPCAARPLFTGSGVDATIQRVVLDGIDRAACSVGSTREQFVLSLAPGGSHGRTRERRIAALRRGLRRAIDAGESRGDVPGLLGPLLRTLAEHAPIDQILEGRASLGGILGALG